jgi:hypothetical protein
MMSSVLQALKSCVACVHGRGQEVLLHGCTVCAEQNGGLLHGCLGSAALYSSCHRAISFIGCCKPCCCTTSARQYPFLTAASQVLLRLPCYIFFVFYNTYLLCRPDYDFGQAPIIMNTCKPAPAGPSRPGSTICKKTVVAGQKSGFVWSLHADNGTVSACLYDGML